MAGLCAVAEVCGVEGEQESGEHSPLWCSSVVRLGHSACPLVYIVVDTIEFIVLHCSVLLAAQLLFLIVLYK